MYTSAREEQRTSGETHLLGRTSWEDGCVAREGQPGGKEGCAESRAVPAASGREQEDLGSPTAGLRCHNRCWWETEVCWWGPAPARQAPGRTLKPASHPDNCSGKMSTGWGFAIQKMLALLRQAPAFPFRSSCPTRSLLV